MERFFIAFQEITIFKMIKSIEKIERGRKINSIFEIINIFVKILIIGKSSI